MKNILIVTVILSAVITSKIIIANSPDVVVIWSRDLDKEKRELVKKLRIKTEIEIKRNIYESDSTKNSTVVYVNEYDEEGNQINYKFYTDTLMINPHYQEEYITDENGNVIEAYREGKLIGTQEFDGAGRKTDLINYDEDGDINWSYEYEYDDEGNLVLELQYLYEELIDTNEYYAYEYIQIGQEKFLKSKISLLSSTETIFTTKEIYDYDSLGRDIFYQEYGPDWKIFQQKYRDYSSMTGYIKFYREDGNLEFIDSLKLNTHGKPIVILTFEKGILSKRRFREYNENAKLISDIELSEDGKRLFEWHYNDSGQEIEFKRYENEVVNYFRTSKYLVNGLQINTITVNSKKGEKETRDFRYEYYK
jgi:hypothetical protein